MDLPNCSVVLNRITDEEIHRLCSPSGNNKAVKGVRVKSGVKCRKRTHLGLKHRKNGPEKVTAKTKAVNEFQFCKLKKKSLKSEETAIFLSNSSLCPSPVKIKSKIQGKKKGRKRRKKFKNILQTSDSSVNNEVENAVDNARSNNLNSDVNSTLQNSNPSSKYDLHHQEGSLAIDLAVSPLKGKQNNNTSQSCSIISIPELHYSYSAFEDIPLSTLKNMYGSMVKKTKTPFNCEIQSNDDKKTKSLRRKRKKLKKISSESKKPRFNNFDLSIKQNAIKIQKLDGSVEKRGKVCRFCSSAFSTSKKRETTPKKTICTFCYHLKTHTLSSSDCNSDYENKSKEGGKIKRRKKAESRVSKVLKKSETRGYFVQKARKSPPKVIEVNGEPDRVNGGRKIENSNSKITNNATKTSVKINKQTEKSKHQKSQINEDETIIGPLKQNQNSETPCPLILNKMVKDSQTIQSLNKTSSHDIGKDINFVNATRTQKKTYSSRSTSSKSVRDDSIQVTQFNLNTYSPKNKVLLDKQKYTKLAKCNASFIPDQSNFAVYLQHRNVPMRLKSKQFEDTFGEKTANELSDILTIPDSPEKCHLRDEYQTLQRSEMSVPDNVYEIYDTKKPHESTVIKDTYSFPSNSPRVMSNVYSDCFNTQEYFQNEISSQIDLKKFTSRPQCNNKTGLNNTVYDVENINASGTEPSKISPLSTFSVLKLNNFGATGVPVNKKANKILLYKNSPPNFTSVNSSISYTSSKEYFSDEKAIHPKDAKISNFISFETVNPQDMEIKISNVSSFKFFANRKKHFTEFNKVGPLRLDININNLNSKTGETISSIPVEKYSSLLSNIEDKPVSEVHSDILGDHFSNDLLKHECNTSENLSLDVDSLDVVTILAITDLGENPQLNLNVMITVTKARLEELSSKKNKRSQLKDAISYTRYNLHILNTSQQYLSLYGSFSKVSDNFLKNRRAIQLESGRTELSERRNPCPIWKSESPAINTSILSDLYSSNLKVSSLPTRNSFDAYYLNLQETATEFQS